MNPSRRGTRGGRPECAGSRAAAGDDPGDLHTGDHVDIAPIAYGLHTQGLRRADGEFELVVVRVVRLGDASTIAMRD